MRRTLVTVFGVLVALTLGVAADITARTQITYIGNDIPDWIPVRGGIFAGSDTLLLNNRQLERGIDYAISSQRGGFDMSLTALTANDTLTVIYHPLPTWLKDRYGRIPPPVSPPAAARTSPAASRTEQPGTSFSPDVTISGAKSFLFSARSAGTSGFSQTLDLHIQGSLGPGVDVIGTVSDRGYDAAYGPSNSRLSELDRLNLALTSPHLSAQVGDMAVRSRFASAADPRQRVSGATFTVHAESWYAEALAARPRGRFETVRFYGTDRLQGPYRIGAGASAVPIVPGSEQVWLDGELLERGAEKDYIIDYPTGQLTFTVRHPIDRRSRIEVDFEPRATDFRGELYTAGGGAAVKDSALFVAVEFLREGDDREQPLLGDLTDDEIQILSSIGDSLSGAVRSGVSLDTAGAYILVTDSLPDSIYQFVGAGNGAYSVTFSFVGSAAGDYRFLGGEHYQYAGPGQGDYRPLVNIPVPERTDYYNARVGHRSDLLGNVTMEIRQTVADRNLLSGRDDSDNRGALYSLSARKQWTWQSRINQMFLLGRFKEAEYHTRQRLYPADFVREFLLPGVDSVPRVDEALYRLHLKVSPASFVQLSPHYAQVDYRDTFESRTGGLRATVTPYRGLASSFSWRRTEAANNATTTQSGADATTATADVDYHFSDRFGFGAGFESDRRENDYRGEERGTRYNRYTGRISAATETVNYEHYVEDSLTGSWGEVLKRDRISALSSRSFGDLSTSVQMTFQWLTQQQTTEESFLGRWQAQYHNARQRLNVDVAYVLSEETRNARGITYIEVERGQGDFIQENGDFIPDPDGNFIRVEEILSNRARVSGAEKSFHLSRDFTFLVLRFNSTVREELLESGTRSVWWIVPFLSDIDQPYLFFSRRHDADVRLIPVRGGHGISITASEERERRDIAGDTRDRRDLQLDLTFKQAVKAVFFEENLELFDGERDNYYAGGGTAEGYRVGMTVTHVLDHRDLSMGTAYRRAHSDINERSEIFSLLFGSRFRLVKKGELRSSLELYRQSLHNTMGSPSFQLTGNRPGERGAVWTVSARYGLKGGMRINMSVSGRHADTRVARITGRGEMVVTF